MWSPDEYARQAESVADAFCAGQGVGGNDLSTLVEKVARDNALNPEQIRRLGRAANTAVFGRKYASRRGEPDRRIDFDPVDAETIISRLQSSAAPQLNKVASYPDLPDPRRRPVEKTAGEVREPAPRAPPAVPRWSHLQKLASELPIELRQLDIRWQSNLRALAEDCRAQTHDHVSFEKNAVAVLGAEVLTELNGVRDLLGFAPLVVDRAKLAEAHDEALVGVEDRSTRLLRQASLARAEYAKKLAELNAVREALPAARKEAFRAR